MTTDPEDIERQEKVRARAHAIWEQEGRPDGRHLEHWRRAKRSIVAEELRAMAAALDAEAVSHKFKAYFDNVIVSGRIRDDLRPKEFEAVQHLIIAEAGGVLEIVTSREAWHELERTRGLAMRAQCKLGPATTPILQENHRLLRIEHRQDPDGVFVAWPVLTEQVDAPLFVELANAGLPPADASHLMYAVANRCDRFVTLDTDFGRRPDLSTLCRGLLIVKPSELAAEILAA